MCTIHLKLLWYNCEDVLCFKSICVEDCVACEEPLQPVMGKVSGLDFCLCTELVFTSII